MAMQQSIIVLSVFNNNIQYFYKNDDSYRYILY